MRLYPKKRFVKDLNPPNQLFTFLISYISLPKYMKERLKYLR